MPPARRIQVVIGSMQRQTYPCAYRLSGKVFKYHPNPDSSAAPGETGIALF